VTISLLGLTSAVLGYAGIELGGAYVQRGRGLALAAACVLLASAVLFSEYGVPVALAGAVLIGAGSGRQTDGSRWRRGAAAFAVTAVAAFAIYHVVGDSSARARVDPLRPVLYPERLADAPLDLLTRAWQVVVGAYGEGASELRVSWDTKSSLIAVAAGCALAATLIGIARPSQTPETPRPEDRKPLVLALAALAFGLAPVALMQAYEPTAFASRFHLPVLPIAAVLTVSLALSMSRPRFQVVAIAVLGLLAGVATVRQAWNGWRRQEMMASIGAGVRPLVRATDGLTVVVLTGEKACPWDYACTAEATARWTAEEGRSVWFSPARELPFDLDRESVCSGSVVLDASVRSIRRTGRVGQVLWVDVRPDGFRLWPYCEPPGRGA
jgi:hypothetical protein